MGGWVGDFGLQPLEVGLVVSWERSRPQRGCQHQRVRYLAGLDQCLGDEVVINKLVVFVVTCLRREGRLARGWTSKLSLQSPGSYSVGDVVYC